MDDLNRLRELRELRQEELIDEDEYVERKMVILDRMLQNASNIIAELPPVVDVKAATVVRKPAQQGVGDSGPPAGKRDSQLAMERKRERLNRRLSQNVRRSAAPIASFAPGLLEARSVTMEEAAAQEREILATCKATRQKWTDPEFPLHEKSITRVNRRLLKNFDHWERLSERSPRPSLFVGGSGSGDVIQGEVGNCWFLGALAMCATRQDDLLYPLFVTAHPDQGFFQIRFFIDAEWRVVAVDDWVPVKRLGSMIFAHCKDEDEYWVALVESKQISLQSVRFQFSSFLSFSFLLEAYAKLNGTYEHLGSGNFSEAMSNLTGEGSEAFPLTPDMAASDEMWAKLEYYVEEEFLMGCSIEGVGEHDNGRGLLTGHAYGIMACRTTLRDQIRLVKIFNPWGMKEWTGPWSDGSVEWTPELERELDQTDEDDGMFWMTYEDWLANYNMFSVCRLLTDDVGKIWEKTIFAAQWDAETAGGCCNYDSWIRNHQYWLTVTQDTQMFFHLARQDGRVHGRPKFTEAIGCYVFEERDLTQRKKHRYRGDLYQGKSPLFIASREFSASTTMPPGSYLLMPCTFEPGQMGRFWLTVYAEDPVQCGVVGFGPSRKEDIVRVDTSKIALLNRPDDEEDEPPAPPPAKPTPKPAAAAVSAGPTCVVCGLSSKGHGKVFRMEGNRYHVACFKCAVCKSQLEPADFYQDAQGRAVCEDHAE